HGAVPGTGGDRVPGARRAATPQSAHARAIRKPGGAHRLSRLHARRAGGGRRHSQPDRGFAAALHTPWAAAVGGRSARAERAPQVLGRPVSTALPAHSRAGGNRVARIGGAGADSSFYVRADDSGAALRLEFAG